MRPQWYRWRWWGLALLIAGLGACEGPGAEQSDWFRQVVGDPEAETFRGIRLGDSLGYVRTHEQLPLQTDDAYGLVYQLQMGMGEKAVVEYMGRMGSTRKVESIILNAFLPDEGQATDHYNELEAWLRSRYGVPDGSFGRYQWKSQERQLDITLRLLNDKKSFSLNFARPIGL